MLRKFITQLGFGGNRGDTTPVRTPKRRGDVGYDLCAAENTVCARGITWVHTGVAIDVGHPLWCQVLARSSLHKKGLFVAPGIIDSGYQGELLVAVINLHDVPVRIVQGEYIAQCIFFQVIQPGLQEVQEFRESERGTNGFGSTDR